MATHTWTELTLYADHLPEVARTVNADKSVTEETLPGFISVGVEISGVKRELARFKAGGFLDDLRRLRAGQSVQPAPVATREATSSGAGGGIEPELEPPAPPSA